ncbi:MAG: homocysteine S-methyltransferase [Anaerolineae bacterium]|nr:homocysteine S-methyltransferase [Anaerolineae bacterium]
MDLIKPFLDFQELLVVDGGLATELEWRGYNLHDPLWSARLLLEEPSAIQQVHADYLWAGADCIIAASYQATLPGLMACGLSEDEAADLLRLAVKLACAARDMFWVAPGHVGRLRPLQKRLRPLVAASIGPYGAYLANGAEYTGDYGLDTAALVTWHRARWHMLASSGADLLACETCPSYSELEAYCELLAETPQMPAWVSFTARDGRHISDGTPIADCATRLHDIPNVLAVGVNCTPPRLMPELIAAIQSVTDKYIIVYPNSGERYDPVQKVWCGESDPSTYGTMCREWRKMGAVLIGGCCRTRPSHIRQIRDRVLVIRSPKSVVRSP